MNSASGNGAAVKDLYEIGEIPPLGHVPANMYAWAIRKERHGPPETSMLIEVVLTWKLDSHEVLVLVMAAGVNYNGVWAALGEPVSVLNVHKNAYHIAGSDASGIVGRSARRSSAGRSATRSSSMQPGRRRRRGMQRRRPDVLGVAAHLGLRDARRSFAQYCRVQDRQLMPRPQHLTWEESASYTLTLATAYRMLFGHEPHRLRPGDNVLVWGASGGLGVFGVQLCAAAGAGIGVISDESKREYVLSLGAKGVINRKNFKCWGQLPTVSAAEFEAYMKGGAQVRQSDWEFTDKKDVDMVFEHPGETDVPDLMLRGQARRHGGVLRRNDRLQPHLRRAIRLDAAEAHPGLALRPLEAGRGGQQVRHRAPHRPLPVGSVPWDQIPLAHTKMWKNQHAPGNMAVLVNAPRTGLRTVRGRAGVVAKVVAVTREPGWRQTDPALARPFPAHSL